MYRDKQCPAKPTKPSKVAWQWGAVDFSGTMAVPADSPIDLHKFVSPTTCNPRHPLFFSDQDIVIALDCSLLSCCPYYCSSAVCVQGISLSAKTAVRTVSLPDPDITAAGLST